MEADAVEGISAGERVEEEAVEGYNRRQRVHLRPRAMHQNRYAICSNPESENMKHEQSLSLQSQIRDASTPSTTRKKSDMKKERERKKESE